MQDGKWRGKSSVKRLFDIFVSFRGLVLLFPFLLLVAVFIKLDSSGPVFFRQERIARGFRPFQILKFRTMGQDYRREVSLLRWGMIHGSHEWNVFFVRPKSMSCLSLSTYLGRK